jgi:hypothetical protein
MSKAQFSPSASDAESAVPVPMPASSGPMAIGEAGDESGMDDGSGSDGRTLLSRPPPAQGRRSLFRR